VCHVFCFAQESVWCKRKKINKKPL
jgi:hypothetical protein